MSPPPPSFFLFASVLPQSLVAPEDTRTRRQFGSPSPTVLLNTCVEGARREEDSGWPLGTANVVCKCLRRQALLAPFHGEWWQ